MSAKTKRTSSAEKAKPELHVRVGGVRIPVWRNETEDGPYFKAGEPELSYKGSDDQWHEGRSYSARDLVNLMKAAALAHTEILRLNRENKPAAEPEDDAGAD